MKPVKCAVVGIGMIGTEHAAILAGNPCADLLYCCDIDPTAKERIPAGVAFTTELSDCLETPTLEAVWVCTPQHLHLPVVEAALSRGLQVFCEKPIAASLADADAMVTAAEDASGTLVIGHTLRFDPDYIAVAEAARSGTLGEIVHMSARWNAPQWEGRIISGRTTVPLEMAIHDIDIMLWLAGDVERVYGEATSIQVVGRGPDAAVGTLRFRSGAVGALDHNWIMNERTGMTSDHRLAVFGTKGAAYVESRGTPAVIFTEGGPNYLRNTYCSYPRDVPFGVLPTEDACFLAKVRDGRSWPISLKQARSALITALALDRSITTSEPIAIEDMAVS